MMVRGIYKGGFISRQDAAEGKYYCPKCKRPLYITKTPGYFGQCFHCDEDFYMIEALSEGNECGVMVGRPLNGITVNGGIEYLLNSENKRMIFDSPEDAKNYLIQNGVSKVAAELFYYIDAAMQTEIEKTDQ